MAPHTQYKHIVFPRLRLGAVLFPKVFLPWPLCQSDWRAVEGLASPRLLNEKAFTCSFCGTATGPACSFHLTRTPPPLLPSQEGLPAGTGGSILPWSALQLYPSDKALCVPSLFRFCLTLTIELRSFCYLRLGVSESAAAYLRKSWDTCALLIQFPHGRWPTRPDGCG